MMQGVNAQIVELISEYEELITAAERLVAQASDASFVRPPEAHRWSPAECIAHLTITNEAYLPSIRKAVAAGQRLPKTRGKYRRDLAGFLLSRRLEPTPRSAQKTPAHSDAVHLKPRLETLAEYVRSQRELQYLAWDSAGLDLGRLDIASPFNPSVSYNLYSAYRVLGALGRRHLAQAAAAAG